MSNTSRNYTKRRRELKPLHCQVDAKIHAALRQIAEAMGLSIGGTVEALVGREMRRQDRKRAAMASVSEKVA